MITVIKRDVLLKNPCYSMITYGSGNEKKLNEVDKHSSVISGHINSFGSVIENVRSTTYASSYNTT